MPDDTPILPSDDASIEAWFNSAINREQSGFYGDLKTEPVKRVVAEIPGIPRPVTIAGTKGKGSTLRMLECLLLAHDTPTVAFTSPHIRFLRERWRLHGEPIETAACAEACRTVQAIEQATDIQLTYFERCFAVACALAAQAHAKDPQTIFLLEVGIGGRLDCANVLDTRLAICTSLGLDHCAYLGDTLQAIAGEKLAIARPDSPLLIASQDPAAQAAVAEVLPGISAGSVIPVERESTDAKTPAIPTLGLLGAHQRRNAATALTAASILLGPEILTDQRSQTALANCQLAGRCQLLRLNERRIIIDGAHTEPSLAATIATAQDHLRLGWQLILGLAKDKDADRCLQAIPEDLSWHRCAYDSPRSRQHDDWPGSASQSPWHDSLAEAIATIAEDTDICISGSLYLAGEALEYLDPSAKQSPPG